MKLEDLKSHYLAFVLSEKGRAELLRLVKPAYPKVVCHHVTLKFDTRTGLTKEETEMVGKPANVMLRGVIDDGKGVQALTVSFNGETERPDGSFYHITHSLGEGRKPVESNRLNPDDADRIKGIIQIDGTVQLVKK